MKRLVLASNNAGKLRELRALLGGRGIEVIAQGDLGIEPAEEPHGTFLENALAKARHAAAASGLPALADDSGICAVALGGAPGVRSARFAGEPASDERNNRELLRQLAPHADRRVHYTCVLVALRSADDPEPLVAEGRWHGVVQDGARGTGGFGYDPLVLVPELGLTVAEIPAEQKNRLSHRGQAMRALDARLGEAWGW
ncbi:MAG TPA: RdgB/HAM1 family non-canonical purine NTP pyrophosphatase [Burkholderiaceae bacterium]|nr:RdgB/HAM1 family non-canonical purine NTP pyrophosphatase [Burkholderiaceae bacterium]HPE02166.1 RdgB/HAM1 family non-canonical purine NTP pyrophosphatase [Burkholderiaceae bacterium]HRZ01517.1 RdgB/HAM1 family non-canonical purine NTP pyrophosphatase [Burkholderiaceae bacterium]